MAVLVWFTIAVGIWHFSVFVPDRFRGGIVGAFGGSILGALLSGAIWQAAQGDSLGTTDVVTALAAVPGCLLGMAVIYALGVRKEREEEAIV